VAVLDAISTFADALRAGSVEGILAVAPRLVSIAAGVVLGVVVVSNGVRWLLKHYRELTLGALLGLLLGAVAGLWPFQAPIDPEIGTTVRGVLIETELQARSVPLKHRSTVVFTPSPLVAGGAVGLAFTGFAISIGIARLGGTGRSVPQSSPSSRQRVNNREA